MFPETLNQLEQCALNAHETVSFKPLLGQFSRFCLRGAKTIDLLQKVFHPVSLSVSSDSGSPLTAKEKAISDSNGRLFLEVLGCEGINKVWPPGGVLSFETLDCREVSVSKDGQSSLRVSRGSLSGLIEKELPGSGRKRRLRWPQEARTNRLRSFSDQPSNETLNRLRHRERLAEWTVDETSAEKAWVIPTSLATQPSDAVHVNTVARCFSFPILLVRTRGQGTEEGCLPPCPLSSVNSLETIGWDLILPSSCAMIVWLALVYGGACGAGIEEMAFVDHCAKLPVFPSDYPDTPTGRQHWSQVRTETEHEINKRPPRKKQTRSSLSYPHWNRLYSIVTDIEGSLNVPMVAPEDSPVDFVVIRSMDYLSPFVPGRLFDRRDHTRSAYSAPSAHEASALSPLALPFRTALRVVLSSTGRGVPQRGAQIFAPFASDYQLWIEHRSQREKKTTSRGRRVADWWGQQQNGDRRLIGYVTSSVKTQLSNNLRMGMGFCEALALRETLHTATHICQEGGGGEALVLVLYKNPQSKWYRPALIELQAH
jgi:hypothetical protein